MVTSQDAENSQERRQTGSSTWSVWQDQRVSANSGSFPAAGESGIRGKAWLEGGGLVSVPPPTPPW